MTNPIDTIREAHRTACDKWVAAERRANYLDAALTKETERATKAEGEAFQQRQRANDLADALRELTDWLGPDSPRAERARAALDRHIKGGDVT